MRSIDDRRLRHWVRQNLFDPWQVLGAAGLVVGILALGFLAMNARHARPSSDGAFQLIQTLLPESGNDRPRDKPGAQPSPSNHADSPPFNLAIPQPGPTRSTTHRPKPAPGASASPASPSDTPTPEPTVSETPTPEPTPSDTPSPEPTPVAS